VLPILLGITMWLMQKPESAADGRSTEAGLCDHALVPDVHHGAFAAGLQLYWVVSNLISIGQQKWLYSKHPILKEQMAKEEAEKKKAKA
jgi:YidC/Oxa1 family membrane protein insertase